MADPRTVAPVGARIGEATYRPGQRVDDLLRAADTAMVAVKSAGRSR